MFRRKWLLVLLALLLIGGGAGAYFARQRVEGTRVTTETVQKRNLEAIVSASGKIDPKRSVNISAQTMGRVTRIGVEEGDRVKAGQFLLQIDPVAAESIVRRDEAALGAAHTGLEQARVQLVSARASLDVARQALTRQQELWQSGLTTREALEKAEAEVQVRESDLNARELLALAPLATLCLYLGLFPQTLIDVIKPDVDSVALIYRTHLAEPQRVFADPSESDPNAAVETAP